MNLKRRGFFGAAAGLAALGCAGTQEKEAAAEKEAAVKPFEFDEATIGELRAAMQSGRCTARYITGKYLTRIEEIDRQGPKINSVIELNPEAEQIAEALDAERKAGRLRGPLHGVPVLIKDNIGTADKMSTSAGSLALDGSTPAQDSGVAAKLRQAGAVILGKTNLSEWANFRSSQSTSGWSGRGGLTLNPYALDRNACGSSSGSGAAAAASLCAVAVGTETDGSIIGPSSVNCLVGLKPTVGLVSRSGIIPISHTQDTAGPMTRTVADLALLLGAIAGPDPRDPATSGSQGKALTDYTQFLDPGGLKGARIGVPRKFCGFSDALDKIFNGLLEEMKRQGAEIIDPAEMPEGKDGGSEYLGMLYEFKADLNLYLEALGPGAPVHSIKEIIEFNESHRELEMPYFGQDIMVKAEAKGPLTTPEYLENREKVLRGAREQGIDKLMDELKLDAILAPSGGPPSSPAAAAGYPNLNVPAGFIFGLPFGISFFGRAWSEPVLIRIAYAFEQATKVRKPPRFLPTADLSV